MTLEKIVACSLSLALTASCGGDDGTGGGGGTGGTGTPDPEEEGCEHFEEDAPQDVTAADVLANAPAVAAHAHWTVILADLPDPAGYGGYVKLEADEEGDWGIFLSASAGGTTLWSAGGTVEQEAEVHETDIQTCPAEMAAYSIYELSPAFYVLELLDTTQTSVGLVIAPTSGHGH
jgi:hypothetical protein